MEPSTLFETTKAAFARFKAQGNRCHYPNNLKADALKLLEHYSDSSLCAAFGVTRVSLRNWRKDNNQQANSSPTFMTLDLDEPEPEPESKSGSDSESLLPKVTRNAVALTLHLPHQLSLSLPEQSVKKTVQFVCALIKEFDSCCI